MTISVEALLIMALMMAVFAAVSTVGSSLYLGAGYERLRAGFETIKKQTAFFSTAIHTLDQRVDAVEKKGEYFFEAIHNLEQMTVQASVSAADEESADEQVGQLVSATVEDTMISTTDSLLLGDGFLTAQRVAPDDIGSRYMAEEIAKEVRFH